MAAEPAPPLSTMGASARDPAPAHLRRAFPSASTATTSTLVLNAPRWTRARLAAITLALGLAPLSIAGALAVMTWRGPRVAAWVLLALSGSAVAGGLAWALRRRRALAAAMIPGLVACLAFVWTYRSDPIPRAPAPGALPAASPPPAMRIEVIRTARIHRSAAFAYRGGTMFDARDFAMNAILVRHPAGDLLIDAGIGRDIDAQLRAFPWVFRALTSLERGQSAAEQFVKAGYDVAHLRGVLLTHAHWDHVSGLVELGTTPVLVTGDEQRWIEDGGTAMEFTRKLAGIHYERYELDGGPYAGFEKSHDVYGDGSVVLVEVPGHTPGSVAVFVTPPTKPRYLFIGDLAWQLEGITRREERPWLTRTFVDADPVAARQSIARVAALAEADPELVIVPAHDARAYEGIPAFAP